MHSIQPKNMIPTQSQRRITRDQHFRQSWLLVILLLACFGHLAMAQDLPASVSLAQYQTSIKDQGPRGTCWAFGGVAALEAAYKRKHSLELDLSEQYTFHMAKVMDLRPTMPESY